MPRVFIADKLEAAGLELLTDAGIDVDYRPGLKGAELQAALQAADAVICRSQPKIGADLLEQPGKLRAIARAGVGVDTIDVPAATKQGIVVMNTPGGNTVSAAEHTIALMFALARQIPAADATMKAAGWDRNKFLGTQLAGKTLGVVGLGRIGLEVARRAKGLDMEVIGYDPFVTSARAAELGLKPATNLAELLPKVDFLTFHIPLTPETKNLVGAVELAQMKKSARILNVSRGGIVEEQALADALKAGTIAGAGIDVFSIEPAPADHPLRGAPNIVLTPHLGASTAEAQENVALEAAMLIKDFLLKGVVANAVNMAPLDRKELDDLRQYLALAWRLGRLHYSLADGRPIREVILTYRGELTSKKTNLLTAAFLTGLLEVPLAGGVNLVNAEVTAKARGIAIRPGTDERRSDFAALLHTKVKTDEDTHVAAGTLFGGQFLRLVQLGPYRLETYLDGTLFVFEHTDRPGLIGFVGNIFGKHDVNIAAMNVGRTGSAPGGKAIGVLNLDSDPPMEAVQEIVTEKTRVERVWVVKLPARDQLPSWLA